MNWKSLRPFHLVKYLSLEKGLAIVQHQSATTSRRVYDSTSLTYAGLRKPFKDYAYKSFICYIFAHLGSSYVKLTLHFLPKGWLSGRGHDPSYVCSSTVAYLTKLYLLPNSPSGQLHERT